MVNPLFFAFAKFLPNSWQLIAAAESYGWYRVYRRLCEGVRATMPKAQQANVRSLIKESLRFPMRSYELLLNNDMINFSKQYASRILEEKNLDIKVPPFFITIAKVFFKRTPVGKFHELLEKEATRRRKKGPS